MEIEVRKPTEDEKQAMEACPIWEKRTLGISMAFMTSQKLAWSSKER